MNDKQAREFIAVGRRTVVMERDAVAGLERQIGAEFVRACEILLQCRGRAVVSGVGKSGHIARKIAATLASTGTPSLFVHAAEAGHGDMGMITTQDAVLALSHSGAAPELLALAPLWKRLQAPVIAVTGNPESPLAQAADVHLDTGVRGEACPLDLAPTSSAVATLALGDAIAIALLEARGFSAEDFAFSHPSGALGRRLLLKVGDVMHSGEVLPRVQMQTTLAEALEEISARGMGMTTVVDEEGVLQGVFTDGDLRRAMMGKTGLRQTPIGELMTAGGRVISPDSLAAEAMNLMEEHKITALVCVDRDARPIGVVHLHDLLRAGLA